MSLTIFSPNIGGVLARMRRRHEQVARIPMELPAKHFGRYLEQMRTIAATLLTAEFPNPTEAEQTAINVLIGTIAGRALKERMLFHMTGRPAANLEVTPDELLGKMDRTELMKGIREWVETEKDLTDLDKNSEGEYDYYRIANRVFYAAMADPENWFSTDEDGEGALNPTGLAHFLGKGPLAKLLGAVNLPAERINMILRNILDAWRAWALVEFQADTRAALREAINVPVPRT